MTVDGFGFGTLTGESCLKNVHCHTDRVSWDAILVTVFAFGALMWKKCAQSHSFGLGRVGGGGGDHIYCTVTPQIPTYLLALMKATLSDQSPGLSDEPLPTAQAGIQAFGWQFGAEAL